MKRDYILLLLLLITTTTTTKRKKEEEGIGIGIGAIDHSIDIQQTCNGKEMYGSVKKLFVCGLAWKVVCKLKVARKSLSEDRWQFVSGWNGE